MIKGESITLYVKTAGQPDAFGHPTYTETTSTVDNVLITPVSADGTPEQDGLESMKEVYEIHIPKTDTNNWEDTRVAFWGKSFQTVGAVKEYMLDNTPLDWKGSIKVERYDSTDRT